MKLSVKDNSSKYREYLSSRRIDTCLKPEKKKALKAKKIE